MATPKKLTAFTGFIDGQGYAGKLTEVELPKLTIKTDEHRAGDMDAPVEMDMGMEKLESTFTFAEIEPNQFADFGIVPGKEVPLTARGALGTGPDAKEIIVQQRGRCKEIDFGSWKAGDDAPLKRSFALTYYKLTVAGQEVVEIDIENHVRKINGTDQLAAMRSALGL